MIATYPELAISSSPVRKAWADAVGVSDRTPETIFKLAATAMEEVGAKGCQCLAQIPMFPVLVNDSQMPSIDADAS